MDSKGLEVSNLRWLNLRLANQILLFAFLFTVVVDVAAEDYTFSCWKNGWRKNASDRSADIFAVETSRYGFTLDVADFKNATLGRLENPTSYEQALKHKTEKLEKLPSAELLIEIEVDGLRYQAKACAAGLNDGVKHLASVRLWESGRYVQHYDFLELDFRSAEGKRLKGDARLDLVAWPESLTFNLHVSAEIACKKSALRLGMKSRAGNWEQESKVDGPWKAGQEKTISLTCSLGSSKEITAADVSVRTAGKRSIPSRFDVTKNCYVATAKRLRRDWRTGYTDIRHYDDFEISVRGSDSRRSIPFLLDLRPPANVTGVCPILCDAQGRPLGIPVQLSKNWHYKPMGSYVMAYAMLPVQKSATYLLRFAYGFYGKLPSASHAQLSLVGYGGNGRWDQLAIGCWGETICFDMDMSLVDVAVTDIRMLMVRSGARGKMWGWTNAGWGGDWLNIQDAAQRKYFQNNLKTAYLSHGPCLSEVRHEGFYGANREVDFSARIQTLRTDDYSRTFQKLSYTFTRDVSAKKVWLFKLGRTHTYKTPQIAYGNTDGLIGKREVPSTLEKGQLFLDKLELTGDGPHWVAFLGAAEAAAKKPKPNGYRALIIRDYKAVIGGKVHSQPTISAPVHRAGPTNLDIELLAPSGLQKFSKGDRIELDLELITLPREAQDYYGPNEFFRKHLSENSNSWRTTYREVQGNELDVRISGGKEIQNYPLIVQVQKPEVSVVIKGGVGAVPIRFEGLASSRACRLNRVIDGKRLPLDQSVHGNDFWQCDFDAASGTYKMSFNLPLDGLDESEWVFTH